MEVHFTPEMEKKLNDLAVQREQGPDELVQDVMADYLQALAGVRETLDNRYNDLKIGRVKPIDGETFFENLRKREDDLMNRSPE
jgi:hypothetical protein